MIGEEKVEASYILLRSLIIKEWERLESGSLKGNQGQRKVILG